MNLKEVKELIEAIPKERLTSIEIEMPDLKIKIAWAPLKPIEPESLPLSEEILTVVRSPVAGSFLRAPESKELPFVKPGYSVKDGTILCVIEARGVQNEIEAEVAGTVEKVLVEDGAPVEINQPLFQIKKRSEISV